VVLNPRVGHTMDVLSPFIPVLCHSEETVLDRMHRICVAIWETGKWPEEWTFSTFIPLHEKCGLKRCANYRRIALVSHASKILLRITLERIRVKTETETADEQAGFRQGMGTRDQITNLRILMHKAREHQQLLYNHIMCFVDFKKAFDSTNKISSKQPKSYLLLTFRPLSEAFIRRSWY